MTIYLFLCLFLLQVSWRPTSSAMVEGIIILPANESLSFVLYNLSSGTSYTVMASVLMLTDSAVFTTLSGINYAVCYMD